MSKSRPEQAGILVLGKTASTLGNALAPILLARVMIKADLGVLAALLVIFNTAVMIGASGFSRTLLYYLPGRELAERGTLARKIASVLVGMGALAGASVLAIDAGLAPLIAWISETFSSASGSASAATPADEQTSQYLPLLALYVFLEMPTRMLTNMLIVEQRAKAAAGTALIKSLGITTATLIPAALGASIGVILTSITAFAAVYLMIFGWFLYTLYRDAGAATAHVSVMEMTKFAIPLGMTDVVNILNHSLDRYLVMVFFTAAAMAEYQMGAWKVPVISTIAYAVGNVYLPRYKELFDQNKQAEAIAIWRQSVVKVSLIVVPVTFGFWVAAEDLIRLLFTDEYLAAVPVFRWYMLLTLGRVAQYGGPILAAGKTRYILYASVFTLLSNLVISLPLTLAIGFVGPALGTAIAFIPTVLFYCHFISKASGVRFTATFPLVGYLKVVTVGAAAGALGWWVRGLLDLTPGLSLAVVVPLVCAAFGVLGNLLGLITREDWRFALDWVRLKILK